MTAYLMELYACTNSRRSLNQSAFQALSNFQITYISVWWTHSTCPLDWGWYSKVLAFWMPMSSHSLLMMLLSKVAPWSLRSLASAPKIKIYPCHRNLANVFTIWLGVTKDQNIHYVWGSVWFHCHLNVHGIHMKQLQRRGDQNSLQGITCTFTCVWVEHPWTAVSSTCWCILSSALATIGS